MSQTPTPCGSLLASQPNGSGHTLKCVAWSAPASRSRSSKQRAYVFVGPATQRPEPPMPPGTRALGSLYIARHPHSWPPASLLTRLWRKMNRSFLQFHQRLPKHHHHQPAPPPVTLETEEGADLQGFLPTPADLLLDSIYGDHVHSNDGTHLNGDILDDRLWQSRWKRMVQILPTRYSVPRGAVRKRLLTILTHEWHQVRDRMDNGWMDGCSYVFFAVVVCLLLPSR